MMPIIQAKFQHLNQIYKMILELAKYGRKAFYGSLTSSAYSLGLTLAGLAASLFTASFMPNWGWRLGFAIALVAGILIFYLRMHVAETPEYQQIAQHDKINSPFIKAIKEKPYAILSVIGIAWLVSIMTFGTYVFTATYLHHYFQLSLSEATLIITLAVAIDASIEPFIAILADKIGFLPIIRIGMIALLLFSAPIFSLLSTGDWL